MIKFSFGNFTNNLISKDELKEYENETSNIESLFHRNEMMGWYKLDELFNDELMQEINETASYVRDNCDVFLVLGIGGSFMGAKAVIDSLNPYFYNQTKKPEIYFIGTSLSSDYYEDLIKMIKDKEIIIDVISKSGTTFETEIAFEIIMDLLKDKYDDEELQKRVIVTTGNNHSALREEAVSNNYKIFNVPDDIGGRYSVFSPVGLLPIAVSGLDISKLYEGAIVANGDIEKQTTYAVIRDLMYKKGELVELYVAYEPKLEALTEWLKQLYAESLGKKGKGILPVTSINTRDLHSLGQFIQEGNKILFETVLNVDKSNSDIYTQKFNLTLDELNSMAAKATMKAHLKAGVLNNTITFDCLDEFNIGYLLQFFMISCVISGYFLDVNPFDQNGVEEYKKNLKELLN